MKKALLRYPTGQRSAASGSMRAGLKSAASSLSLGILLACATILLSACQKAPLKPLDIATGDVCSRCRGAIAEKQFAAEFITKDGFVRKFDDISCMIEHAKNKVKTENIAAYFTMDYPSQKWLKAEEAFYVKSDKFKTPKDSGVLTFKDQSKAQALASQYGAQLVTFNDLLK
jgi:copper chaperone NosL